MIKNVAESLRAAGLIQAEPGMCWRNATNVVYRIPEYSLATYVEGIVIHSDRPTYPQEHGWVEREGEIVDPTLPDMDLIYFPALNWRGAMEVAAMEGQYGRLPYYRTPTYTIQAVCQEIEEARREAYEWLNSNGVQGQG
jgi:hypothetical protein